LIHPGCQVFDLGITRKSGFSTGRKQYTEEQIAFALRQAESGPPVAEINRRLGVSEQIFREAHG
jgi:hypothetical protein